MKDISIGSIVYFINEQGDKRYLLINEVFVSSYTYASTVKPRIDLTSAEPTL